MDGTLPPKLQKDGPFGVNGADDDLAVVRSFALAVLPQFLMGLGIEGGEPILAGHENVFLAVMLDEQRRGMRGADGPVFIPGDLARALVEADQKARPGVMVPGKYHRIIDDQRTDGISPGGFWIRKVLQVAANPDWLAVVRVTGDVGIAESDIDGVLGDGGRVHRQVRFLVSTLFDA